MPCRGLCATVRTSEVYPVRDKRLECPGMEKLLAPPLVCSREHYRRLQLGLVSSHPAVPAMARILALWNSID